MNSILKPRFFACALFLLGLSIPVIASADADLTHPIAELVLKDGRRLKNAMFVSYSSTGVMAKWDGGRGTIMFDDLPEPIASKAKQLRAISEKISPSRSILPRVESVNPSAALSAVVKVETRKISGQVFYNSGSNFRAPHFGGIEVCLYDEEMFRRYEQARNLPLGHDRLLGSSMGIGIGDNRPNMDSLKTYMSDEYKSWDELPPALMKTISDAKGKFTIAAPSVERPLILFARHKINFSSDRGGVRFFAYVWVAKVSDDPNIMLGNAAIEAGLSKGLDVFFKPSG